MYQATQAYIKERLIVLQYQKATGLFKFQSHGDTFQDHARRGDASHKDNRTAHKRGKHTIGTALPYSPRAYTNMDARGRTGHQHSGGQQPCCIQHNNNNNTLLRKGSGSGEVEER